MRAGASVGVDWYDGAARIRVLVMDVFGRL